MDYNARLEQLDAKLMSEGLTEAEEAELALIYSYALIELSNRCKQMAGRLNELAQN